MHIHKPYLPKLLVVAAVTTSFGVGVVSVASATTEPPTDTASMGSEAPPEGGSAPSDAVGVL